MARLLSNAEIDRIKYAVDIAEVIGSRIKLKRIGNDLSGLCPFHQEKTPSFTVSPAKQVYYCFGCGATGNVIKFVMQYEGRTFIDALTLLADQAGIELPKRKERSQYLLAIDKALALYADELAKHNPLADQARQYLLERGVSHQSIADFGLGLATSNRKLLCSAFHGQSITDLEKAGFISYARDHKSTYDRFCNRIVIPIRSASGQNVAATARDIVNASPKYLNTQRSAHFDKKRILFGLDQFKKRAGASAARRPEKAYVVEGPMDVLTLHSAGERCAVGLLGRTVSAEQVRQLLQLAECIVFCFDQDAAGQKSIDDTIDVVLEGALDASRMRFKLLPEGEDPSSLVVRQGLEAFQGAPELGFVQALLSRMPDCSDDDARLASAQWGTEIIVRAKDPVLADAITMAVAKACQISVSALRAKVHAYLIELQRQDRAAGAAHKAEDRPRLSAEVFAPKVALWRAIFDRPSLLSSYCWPMEFAEHQEPAIRRIHELSTTVKLAETDLQAAAIVEYASCLFDDNEVRALFALPAPADPIRELNAICAHVLLRQITEELRAIGDVVSDGDVMNDHQKNRYQQLKTRRDQILALFGISGPGNALAV